MSRAGFSSIEVLIGIVVLAIVLPGLLTGLYDLEAGSGDARLRTLACELAEDQLDEISSKAFEDLDLAEGSFGTEEPLRRNWDDVDDFNGNAQSPPTDALGVAITGASAFTRSITVQNVAAAALNTPVANGTTAIKRVTVTVTWPGSSHGPVVVRVLKARPVSASAGPGGSGWAYVAGSRDNNANQHVEFQVTNNTGAAVSLTGLRAVWTAPVAYYQRIRLRVVGGGTNKTVWDFSDVGSVRAASGQSVTFTRNSPFSVAAGATVTVQLRTFKVAQTGSASNADMDATTFTVTLFAGAVSYPNIAIPLAP